MPKKKIAFVVGHANWGKSSTLRALTNEDFRQRRTTIGGFEFFIRRMSNDDQPAGYIEFMKSLDPALRPYLIAALCPQFDNPAAATNLILTNLRAKGYQLFFWVIEHQYGTNAVVSAKEIQSLRKFGKVEVFSKSVEAAARSRSFKQYVSNVVLA
jgi:hypothetical protein